MYIVRGSGRVHILNCAAAANRSDFAAGLIRLFLSTIREGNYFGELVLDGGPRSASIMALEPCRCFVIPLGDIQGLLDSNPLFAGHLIHMLIGRVRSLVKKVGELALKDVYGRFAKFLDENAIERDGARVVPERLTQQDIAARIGGSREMVASSRTSPRAATSRSTPSRLRFTRNCRRNGEIQGGAPTAGFSPLIPRLASRSRS
jgi:CRP-like cAMP-binding protein